MALLANKAFLRVFIGHSVQWGYCYPVHLSFYRVFILRFLCLFFVWLGFFSHQKTVNILLRAGMYVKYLCLFLCDFPAVFTYFPFTHLGELHQWEAEDKCSSS